MRHHNLVAHPLMLIQQALQPQPDWKIFRHPETSIVTSFDQAPHPNRAVFCTGRRCQPGHHARTRPALVGRLAKQERLNQPCSGLRLQTSEARSSRKVSPASWCNPGSLKSTHEHPRNSTYAASLREFCLLQFFRMWVQRRPDNKSCFSCMLCKRSGFCSHSSTFVKLSGILEGSALGRSSEMTLRSKHCQAPRTLPRPV